jgi:hypothetical protein
VKRQPIPRQDTPFQFPRADPAELAKFDPAMKRCTMNCAPASNDPRSREERAFLCDDCATGPFPPTLQEQLAATRIELDRTKALLHLTDIRLNRALAIMPPAELALVMRQADTRFDATATEQKGGAA